MRSGKIFLVLKFVFISILLIFLVNFFGIPSLNRYLEKSTVFVSERIDYDFNNPPSILISRGDKKAKKIMEGCLNLNHGYEASVQCVDNKLPTKEQMILREGRQKAHQTKSQPTTTLGSWHVDFDEHLWQGKRYILEKYLLEPYEWLDLTFFNETISIEFIDPKFYFKAYKYLTIPKLTYFVQSGEESYLEIVAERFHLLNRPSKPCNSFKEYTFSKCIKVTS